MSSNPTVGSEIALAPVSPGFAKASTELSAHLGLTPASMVATFKAQCFKCRPEDVTDAQMAAFVVIANEMGVNPLLPGMLYAFPVQGGGIVPMMGPDGVFKKLVEHPSVESWQCVSFPEDVTKAPTHATMSIWRKGSERPLTKTVLLSEWKVGNNPNWNTRPRHMLELRAIKQGARMIIHGIPFDEDERQIMGEMNVTGTAGEGDAAGAPPTRTAAPKKEKKGTAAVITEKQDVTPPTGKVIGKAGDNVIEGDFTDVPKDVQTTIPGTETTPPAPPAETTTPPKEEKRAEPPPAEEKKPRAFLQDGEQIDATITVKTVTPMFVTSAGVRTPSIQAVVEGEFNGTVLHIGGGAAKGDGIVPLPMWEPGKTVKATLLGKLNKTSGKVMVRVEKAEEAAAEMSVD
jgi:hypothetical protein